MNEEYLSKIKGFTRTFVTHSKDGPLAAAAAMGKMAARCQEAGSYFRVSDLFIPNVEVVAMEELSIGSTPDQVDTDFKNDWVAHLRDTALPECELKYDNLCTPEKNTIRFLNAYRRRIPEIKPRATYKSRELSIPSEHLLDYENLVTIIQAGGDLRPYLSRAVLKGKSDKNDPLLNSWGIHHLHFRQEGTGQLLFCVITDAEVFLIQVLPHNDWVNTQLLQILHDNWPALIVKGKHGGLHQELFTAADRSTLRSYNANFPIAVSDGTVYLPPTGGTVASGDLLEDVVNCDKIFLEIDYWQSVVTQNVLAIRTALDIPAGKRLVVRMAFNDRDCCFYEATRAIRIGGFAS